MIDKITEKNGTSKVVAFTTTNHLTDDQARQIAAALWNRADWYEHVRWLERSYDIEKLGIFQVIAAIDNRVIARMQCLQNNNDTGLWYYGDLFVVQDYQRMHIADSLLEMAINTLLDKGCHTFRCYVDPDNLPSLNLQKKWGFVEKTHQPFNELINDGQIMFEKKLISEERLVK